MSRKCSLYEFSADGSPYAAYLFVNLQNGDVDTVTLAPDDVPAGTVRGEPCIERNWYSTPDGPEGHFYRIDAALLPVSPALTDAAVEQLKVDLGIEARMLAEAWKENDGKSRSFFLKRLQAVCDAACASPDNLGRVFESPGGQQEATDNGTWLFDRRIPGIADHPGPVSFADLWPSSLTLEQAVGRLSRTLSENYDIVAVDEDEIASSLLHGAANLCETQGIGHVPAACLEALDKYGEQYGISAGQEDPAGPAL